MIAVSEIINIAREAGKAILDVYHDPELSAQVDLKDDNSPLTLADKASHKVIAQRLAEKFPDIPVISEEGANIPYAERNEFEIFWLVDPLDGTKEFIHRNGDFTVNIALIENNYPVAGVVYVPVTDEVYYGEGDKAVKIRGEDESEINVSGRSGERTAVRSRSHASPEEEEVLNRYSVSNTISRGSALKFCVVAEGAADLYYRHGPTMEWDTAAGQAVLEAAGGFLYVGNKPGERFSYNKESLLNPGFLALGFPPDQ